MAVQKTTTPPYIDLNIDNVGAIPFRYEHFVYREPEILTT